MAVVSMGDWGGLSRPEKAMAGKVIAECSVFGIDYSLFRIEMDSAAAMLFGKTRQTLLAQLFERPEAVMYLRDLARQTVISPGPLQHELSLLHKADLDTRSTDGNRVLYRANTAHPIFADLQAIVRRTLGIGLQIKAALIPYEELTRFVAIYGSIANGSGHARSDVDLLVVGDVRLEQVIKAIAPIEEVLGREISVKFYIPQEFRQRRSDGDAFLCGVMDGPLITLSGKADDA